jgi:imidazolonepropionase-like amidohydrolase
MTTYVLCGTLIDATGTQPLKDKALVIEHDRIAQMTGIADVPDAADAAVIDLRAYTVMPGMVDCHEHLILDVGDEAAQCSQPTPWLTMMAVANAKKILHAGITTMRDVGEKDFIDVEIKRGIAAGLIPGPRLLISGHPLIRTGGHAHFLGRETDGVSDMRRGVREQLKQGVDLIKIMVSGGMSTKGSLPDAQEFSDEEIRACIDEARRNGRTVAAHLHGGTGLRVAVEAGVHTVEHGTLLTEEDVKLLAERGTWLITTVGVGEVAASDPATPAFYKEKTSRAHAQGLQVRKWAKQYGVPVAVGNDTNHGRMDTEARALIEAGWTPMEALQALTIRGAEVCGLAEEIGTLEPGKLADIIAVDGDPLTDVAALRDVTFVMKAGVVEVAPDAARINVSDAVVA